MDSDDGDSDINHPLGFAVDAEDDDEYLFDVRLQWMNENYPATTVLSGDGSYARIQNMTDNEWEEIGRGISNNSYLQELNLNEGALNDQKMSSLFRGLTRSNAIKEMNLYDNGFSVAGVRSMVPFLQNANNLSHLHLDDNNISSEGFNVLFRALRDSPIEYLSCSNCGIESIEIDRNNTPQYLEALNFDDNNLKADGCRGLAKLLHSETSTLTSLWLNNNKIDDEGVAILADALRNNTSLKTLGLERNDDISYQGEAMLLKLVNDVSSIEATLRSNHTLTCLCVKEVTPGILGFLDVDEVIQTRINIAVTINRNEDNTESAGREKIIRSQLHSLAREELCHLQGVDHSVYSEIDPLHLPEVLSLIGERHGRGELYAALSSSIMTLLSTVNRKQCVQQQKDYHEAKIAELRAMVSEHSAIVAELNAELVTFEEETAEGNEEGRKVETQSSKRRRL